MKRIVVYVVCAIKVLNFVVKLIIHYTAWRWDASPFCSLSQLLETKADNHLLFNKSTPVLLLYISPTTTHEKKINLYSSVERNFKFLSYSGTKNRKKLLKKGP